jgi:hypothetical protein
MQSFKTYALLVSVCALIILSKGRIDFASTAFAHWDLHSYRVLAIASPHLAQDAIALTICGRCHVSATELEWCHTHCAFALFTLVRGDRCPQLCRKDVPLSSVPGSTNRR